MVQVERDLAVFQLQGVLLGAAAAAPVVPGLLERAQLIEAGGDNGLEGHLIAVELEELVRLAALLRAPDPRRAAMSRVR